MGIVLVSILVCHHILPRHQQRKSDALSYCSYLMPKEVDAIYK